jgi:polysaccharide biosynthesis/export protein
MRIPAAALILVCAACLAGCTGSLGSSAFEPAASDPTQSDPAAFAATPGGAVHSSAAVQVADKFTAAATPGNNAYKIGPLDVLDVSVFKVPDLSKTVQVGDGGYISYPLVGDIPAAGKTAHEVERELEQKLGAKYIRSPQVTVLVKEYNSQRVTVEGSVKTPGVYPMKGKTSLVQALAMAGGIDSTIGSGDIVIFRTIDGKRSAARFDFDTIIKGETEDPELAPGDVIVADTSNAKVALHNVLSVLPIATASAIFVPLL